MPTPTLPRGPRAKPVPVRTIPLGKLADKRWPGKLTDARLDIQAGIDDLDHYYVPSDTTAKTRCIDGRHDPELDENHLGPQVPGGAPGAALAHRLGVDADDLTRGTFHNDAETMIHSYLRHSLAPGGHRDDQRDQNDGIGCGAIDGLDTVITVMTDPDLVDDHKRLVRTLMGSSFDRDNYLRVLGAALMLRAREDTYFADRGGILDLLDRLAPNSVSVLEGGHRECLVVVNFVPDTTMASNRFAADHDGLQAFGYDIWRSRQLAETLLPLPSQEVDRHRFVMARVMITIATLMVLTDGTLPLLAHVPG